MSQDDFSFEWNVAKARANVRKHGVSFEEAATVFDDPTAYTQADERHSDDEPREWLIGYSYDNRLLVIAFVERAAHRIRIISARRATQTERSIYEERFHP
ncbi:MAG: BrnT family toxin [Chloroflexi bacterium]|nr:BrnT family toxin [Chloroflexota bacterium]